MSGDATPLNDKKEGNTCYTRKSGAQQEENPVPAGSNTLGWVFGIIAGLGCVGGIGYYVKTQKDKDSEGGQVEDMYSRLV